MEEEFPEGMTIALNNTLQYQKFHNYVKEQILTKDDYQDVKDKKGNVVNYFIKKSGYFKLKKHYKIQLELVDWKYITDPEKGRLRWAWYHVKGHFGDETIDAFGACDSREKKGKKGANDILGTAHTRAMLRAISQLIDFGSVSADEIAVIEDKGD